MECGPFAIAFRECFNWKIGSLTAFNYQVGSLIFVRQGPKRKMTENEKDVCLLKQISVVHGYPNEKIGNHLGRSYGGMDRCEE